MLKEKTTNDKEGALEHVQGTFPSSLSCQHHVVQTVIQRT